ncbi:metal ABC transporter permease [Pararhizobium haloflavum]|uniref:metal ABC transporter permease n=1 Tax=Pararhizobium haloflavum TaxID=2037914 RepID=UPI000C1A29BF|nr:metal ABC transporter permease [Pararhizobium haloflavum]
MALYLGLTLVPILIGSLAAVSCALLGNFLVLRRQSLMGDAISHVVLPGIVAAFVLTGSMSAIPMLLGAAAAALLAAAMIEIVRVYGKVEPGAAMGVVFTALFAFGIVLLEQTDTGSIHFDVEHALYGNLESLVWLAGIEWAALIDPIALSDIPPQLPRLAMALVVVVGFLAVAWRPLVISTFDPTFAAAAGVPVRLVNAGLIILVAMVSVTAFEAVGAIIAIAMLICPPAAARMMTDRLLPQIAWSVAFAILAAAGGYVAAGAGVALFVEGVAVSAAGMIATVAGVTLLLAAAFGPRRKGAKA